jgi:DNA-binding XRE family transcriptional regulator
MATAPGKKYNAGMSITALQSKMARAALGWNTIDLAKAAEVSPTTVNQFEQGTTAPLRSTLAAIRRAFEDAGIIFIDEDEHGPGVRLASRRAK